MFWDKVKYIVQKSYLWIFLLVYFATSFPGITAYASQSVFTIQTASFNSEPNALTMFDAIAQELDEKYLDSLRIERIGRFYTVRIGKFKDRESADAYLLEADQHLSEAIIMEAYFINERIVKLYESESLIDEQYASATSVSDPEPERAEPVMTEKKYTIQIASFNSEPDALTMFDAIALELDEKYLDSLRIERIGRFYAVRIGKFKDRESADAYLLKIDQHLFEAIIMEAYFINERVVKLYESESLIAEQQRPATSDSDPEPERAEPLMKDKIIKESSIDNKIMPLDEQIRMISELVQIKEYDKALEATKSSLKINPSSSKLNGLYGKILLGKKEPKDAIKYFRTALELTPFISEYHTEIGYCLLQLNNFDSAIDELRKAVLLNAANVDAFTGLVVAYRKLNNEDKAMSVYKRLKLLDRNAEEKVRKLDLDLGYSLSRL